MTYIYLVPQWFFGFNIFIELIFALVSSIVAKFSFKIYKLSLQRESRLFGIGFIFIALSYATKAVLNLILLSNIDDGFRGISFEGLTSIGLAGFYLHIFLFTLGIITLVYTTLKIKNIKLYILMILIALFSLILSCNKMLSFTILSSILLIYLCIYYFIEYKDKRNSRTILVFLGFVFILINHLEIMFNNTDTIKYAVGEIFELVAYTFIMLSLIFTFKKKK